MHSRTNHLTGRPQQNRHRWWRIIWGVVPVAALGLALVSPIPVQAKTFQCGAGEVACLIAAITQANANGQQHNTIRLAAGTYTLTAVDNNTGGSNGLPSITSALTIRGAGADLTIIERATQAPRFRCFHVAASGTLTLRGLTLQGGDSEASTSSGGAILNEGGRLTLIRTTLTDNRTGVRGGAIANVQGKASLVQTTIRDGRAHEGGGLFNDGGTVILTQSFILNNGAGGSGGGLWNGQDMASNTGTMYITHTTIADNGVNGWGGGLTNHGTVIITNSTFADNVSPTFGGAGMWNFGTMTLTNSTVANNNARGDHGGGIRNSGTLRLQNVTVAGNQAMIGGGIRSDGGSVLLRNSIVADNQSNVGPLFVSPNCAGVITSEGHNLIGDPTGCTVTLQPSDLTGDPGLGNFTDDGEPGHGHFPLLRDSPAIDAGNDTACPRTDQLGERRHRPCDIGAIEFQDQDDDQDDRRHEEDSVATAQEPQ
jgi:hypothetical protein